MRVASIPYLPANVAGHQLVVAGQNFYSHSVAAKRIKRTLHSFQWRIDESKKAGQDEIAFVRRREPLGRGNRTPGDREYAKAVGAQALVDVVAALLLSFA